MISIRRIFVLVGFACSLAAASAAAAADLEKARVLLRDGRAADAYALLAASEFNAAGNVDFDYLLAVAALESGRPDRATLILERVLAVAPAHAAARIDLGRAYYALGDLDRAEAEFAAVRGLSPPAAAQATLDRYAALIAERRAARRTRASGYLEAAIGRDSNVNQATSAGSIFLPAFDSSFALSQAGQAQADRYRQLAGGGELEWLWRDGIGLYAGVDLQVRDQRRLDGFDIGNGDLRAGLVRRNERDTWRVGAGFNDYRLENDRYRGLASVLGEWRRELDATQAVTLAGQYLRIRYVADALRANDVDLALVGGGWVGQLAGSQRPVLSANLFAGSEREAQERADGDRALAGVRIAGQITPLASLDLYASVGAQYGRYARENALFLAKRRDTQLDIGVGGNWRFAPAWSLRPQASWTRNDSNLAIHDTSRYDVSLSVRREFR